MQMRLGVLLVAICLCTAERVLKPARIVHDLLPIEIEAQSDEWLVSSGKAEPHIMLETQVSSFSATYLRIFESLFACISQKVL